MITDYYLVCSWLCPQMWDGARTEKNMAELKTQPFWDIYATPTHLQSQT